jgi:hypothetical protein
MNYSTEILRTLALHTQGLADSANPANPTSDDIYRTIDRIGCLQIDTLQMVQRSHYIALWSRLGTYNPDDLDNLLNGNGQDKNSRRLFEYWYHAACLIPLTEYWSLMPMMRHERENPKSWSHRWLNQDGNGEVAQVVLNRIRQEGALRTSHFDHKNENRSGWWDWKPAKTALEVLYNQGILMIAGRVKFQRVYDLRERVLPDHIDLREPDEHAANRHILERSARALGICQPMQLTSYTYMKRTTAKPIIEQLLKEGVLVMVQGEFIDGKTADLVVHKDNLTALEQVADGAIRAERTTFLSPFDSLWYPRGREQQYWGFQQVLEAYKPRPQHIWGYFCLPILWRGRLVGRFDPKLERKTGILRLKALHLEPDIPLDDEMIANIATTMRDFLTFHQAHTLIIEKSNPPAFGEKLLAAM